MSEPRYWIERQPDGWLMLWENVYTDDEPSLAAYEPPGAPGALEAWIVERLAAATAMQAALDTWKATRTPSDSPTSTSRTGGA